MKSVNENDDEIPGIIMDCLIVASFSCSIQRKARRFDFETDSIGKAVNQEGLEIQGF